MKFNKNRKTSRLISINLNLSPTKHNNVTMSQQHCSNIVNNHSSVSKGHQQRKSCSDCIAPLWFIRWLCNQPLCPFWWNRMFYAGACVGLLDRKVVLRSRFCFITTSRSRAATNQEGDMLYWVSVSKNLYIFRFLSLRTVTFLKMSHFFLKWAEEVGLNGCGWIKGPFIGLCWSNQHSSSGRQS